MPRALTVNSLNLALCRWKNWLVGSEGTGEGGGRGGSCMCAKEEGLSRAQ